MHPVLAPLPTTVDETVTDAAGARILTLTAVPAESLLVSRWYGHLDAAAVQHASHIALAFVTRHPTLYCSLSDSTHVSGDWLDLLPWLGYELLPALQQTNIRAAAFLAPTDPSTRLGITSFMRAAQGVFPAQLFEREADARRWLTTYAAR